jgi:DNA-binding beta-propeller fold protein YncE
MVWSDFGPTTAIAQSFALGDNFPTEYPHFPELPILYHFLYYFQVGNLTRLGLDPALANNLLSTLSLVSMLILVMALGRLVFRSPAVGRIGAALFFVHGSLSWWPYVLATGLAKLPSAIWSKTDFLASGFPWRGEEWGIWSQGTFLNQRHLAGSIGILLIATCFVVERYLEWVDERAARKAAGRLAEDIARQRAFERIRGEPPSVPEIAPEPARAAAASAAPRSGVGAVAVRTLDALDELALEFQDRTRRPGSHIVAGLVDTRLLGYVLIGFLLGMLPMWNTAVFVGAAAVFAVLFLLLPNRAQMVAVAIAAGSVALPQLLALRPTGLPDAGSYPQAHFGYTIDNPTAANIVAYLAFTFGPKILLAVLALVAATGLQRRLFLAFTALVGVAFGVQFSVEVFANHKFLNIWLIVLNLFAAAGLIRLWFLAWPRLAGTGAIVARLGGRALAVVLVAVIGIGGVIDLMPIKNTGTVVIRMEGDPLFAWLLSDTKPDDIFLSDLYVTSPILLAGRKIYYGWSYYAWSAGYPVGAREELYRQMLGAVDPAVLLRLLEQEHIRYVAIDDGMRGRGFVAYFNEPLFASTLGKPVFEDLDGSYQHLVIYAVPEGSSTTPAGAGATPAASAPPASMLTGGRGALPGQFLDPRGLTVARNLDVLVADTGNHRIQRFNGQGQYLGVFGGKGDQPGRFTEPNGVAVNSKGHVFVADLGNQRVQEFDENLAYVGVVAGPDGGFYGPRDLFVGPDDSLYVVDQGHARIVRVRPGGTATAFGALGAGAGQLNDPTGVAVFGDQVYVADPVNARIQVFTTDGAFVRSIAVNGWSKSSATADVAVSPDGKRLYASMPGGNAISVINLTGAPGSSIAPTGADLLRRPSALAVRPDGQILVVSFDIPRVTLLPQPGS